MLGPPKEDRCPDEAPEALQQLKVTPVGSTRDSREREKGLVCQSATYVRSENEYGRHSPANIDELIVWGGLVANVGESQLSRIIFRSASMLRSVTYCPDHTKGGCLIRPGYHRGDRELQIEFPVLTNLTIRLDPVLLPLSYGWITPELQHFRLLCVIESLERSRGEGNHGVRDWKLPSRDKLQRWLRTGGPEDLPCALLATCPKLQSITVALCSTADTECEQTVWKELLPPILVPWAIKRLLLLPLLKPVEQDQGDARAGYVSILSNLSRDIIKIIIGFLCRPAWEHKDHDIPRSIVEKFGLPMVIRKIGVTDIVDGVFAEHFPNF